MVYPWQWFCAFLAFLAGVFANARSLAALAADAFGDNFCLSLNGVPFIPSMITCLIYYLLKGIVTTIEPSVDPIKSATISPF